MLQIRGFEIDESFADAFVHLFSSRIQCDDVPTFRTTLVQLCSLKEQGTRNISSERRKSHFCASGTIDFLFCAVADVPLFQQQLRLFRNLFLSVTVVQLAFLQRQEILVVAANHCEHQSGGAQQGRFHNSLFALWLWQRQELCSLPSAGARCLSAGWRTALRLLGLSSAQGRRGSRLRSPRLVVGIPSGRGVSRFHHREAQPRDQRA
uniref:Uncharacterized protein n=1 Tax=Pinguiococcus pyrenoidosus TaxID=172671 RepID=A0A7R9Y7C6_9STRA